MHCDSLFGGVCAAASTILVVAIQPIAKFRSYVMGHSVSDQPTNGLRVTPPILTKFGTLADNAYKKFCEHFPRCRSSSF